MRIRTQLKQKALSSACRLGLLALVAGSAIGLVGAGASIARADEQGEEITVHQVGPTVTTVHRTRGDVMELRGSRRDPDFVSRSFLATQKDDADRWNRQHEDLPPIQGLKNPAQADRAPASVASAKPVTKKKARKSVKNVASSSAAKRKSPSKRDKTLVASRDRSER